MVDVADVQNPPQQAIQARQTDDSLRNQLLSPRLRINLGQSLVAIIVIAILLASLAAVAPDPTQLTRGTPPLIAIANFVGSMFPPKYDYTTLTIAGQTITYPVAINYVIQTVEMALIGTLFGVFLSLPFGLLAARNTSPHPLVYQFSRLILNIIRAFPELGWALVFVAAVGLGPFTGALALAVAGVGSKGKLYAEAIEAIDPQQVMAVQATGAGRLQTFVYSVIPQTMPLVISYSLLSFESNVRAATILGFVGAGGIGLLLYQYFQLFQFKMLLGVILIIIVTVTVIDRLSDYLRRKFI